MKKFLLPALSVCLLNTALAQVESVGPLTRMYVGKTAKQLRASNPIDSSYIYRSDTLSIPVFDDFSKSKFQTYDAQPTDPNVTEELFYQLLDAVTNDPLPANAQFSTDQTFRYELLAGDWDTIPQPSVQVKLGDFSEFPVVYSTVTVYPAYDLKDTLDFPNDIDTLWVTDPVIQDSALIFTVNIDDPGFVWVDRHVYHNYTFAVNPWSLGVATFDGLDGNGYPYNFGSASVGVADFLTSKPIDLSLLGPEDSLFLSFLVQPEGYGDMPEAVDSLVLEFYDAAADQWNYIWSKTGTPVEEFEVGHIRITEAPYFSNGFRFRFKNYGGLSGSLDHFHLDYVHLRQLSQYTDSIFGDFAWSYPIGTLLEDYTQVPWDHWKNNPNGHMSDSVKFVVRNNRPGANNYINSNKLIISYNGAQEHEETVLGGVLSNGDINYAPFTAYTSYYDFSSSYHYDENKPGDDATFDITGYAAGQTPFDAFVQNDSCFSQQYFGDVYAYDDGSAEKAYGLLGAQSRLAIKFSPYEADSLLGVQMHFVPSVNDVSDNLFLLTVWDDNNGMPGAILYQDDFFNARTPVYEEGYNGFTTYYFPDTMKLFIDGPFYVGWRQIDAELLNIGLDMNNANSSSIFYSSNGGVTWFNSSYDASIMMRPLFATAGNADLATDELVSAPKWTVFPNPTTGSVTVRWDDNKTFPGATCFDAQGRVIGRTEEGQFSMDLGGAPAGIYFVQLNGFDSAVKKVIRY
jgi:hypothetical protein